MPSFQFRLETVLRLREHSRDERRAHLGDALRVDAELERQQNEINDELRQHRAELLIKLGPIDVDRMLSGQRYELLLASRLAHLDQQRSHVAKEIELRRQALSEADREVRVLEKLKEQKRQDWLAEERRRDQLRLDEAASIGHARQTAL